jgi:predicted ATP-dependent endonuclease of OLD family
MAHIVRFKIDGLTGRSQPISKTLHRDINIFYGLNGCGKSSLLKILHSALREDASILKDTLFEAASVDVYSLDFDSVFNFKIKRGETNWLCADKTFPASHSWQHEYLPTTRLYENINYYISANPIMSSDAVEESINKAFATRAKSTWTNLRAIVNANIKKYQENGLAKVLEDIVASKNTPEMKETDVINFPEYFYSANSFLKRQKSKVSMGDLEDLSRNLTSGSGIGSDLTLNVLRNIHNIEKNIEIISRPLEQMRKIISTLITGKKQLDFRETDLVVKSLINERNEFDISLLSSGEKHLLKLFMVCVSAKYSSLIIDEPELSMHIDWQKTLVESLLKVNPEAQLILATHSPEVMADIDSSKIFEI